MGLSRISPVDRSRGGRIKDADGKYLDDPLPLDRMKVSSPRASYDYTAAERARNIARREASRPTGRKIRPRVTERRETDFAVKLAGAGVVLMLILLVLFLFTPLGGLVRDILGA